MTQLKIPKCDGYTAAMHIVCTKGGIFRYLARLAQSLRHSIVFLKSQKKHNAAKKKLN